MKSRNIYILKNQVGHFDCGIHFLPLTRNVNLLSLGFGFGLEQLGQGIS